MFHVKQFYNQNISDVSQNKSNECSLLPKILIKMVKYHILY